MTDYTKKVKEIIAKKTGIEVSEIHNDSFFEDDLNVGEFELIEILEEIEDELEADILDRRDEIETFDDLMDILADSIE